MKQFKTHLVNLIKPNIPLTPPHSPIVNQQAILHMLAFWYLLPLLQCERLSSEILINKEVKPLVAMKHLHKGIF